MAETFYRRLDVTRLERNFSLTVYIVHGVFNLRQNQ